MEDATTLPEELLAPETILLAPETSPVPPPSTRFGFDPLLRRAWELWRIQWLRIIGLYLRGLMVGSTVFLPPLILYGVSTFLVGSYPPGVVPGPPGWLLVMRNVATILSLMGVIGFALIQIRYGIAHYQLIAGADERLGVREALTRSHSRLWSFLWVAALMTAVAFGAMLPLFIPWLIWLPTFMMVPWVFVEEDRKGLDVLVQARRWVKNNGFNVFVYTYVLTLLSAAFTQAVIFASRYVSGSWPAIILIGVIPGLIQLCFIVPFQACFGYATYEALVMKQGDAPPDLPDQRGKFVAAAAAGAVLIPLLIGVAIYAMQHAGNRTSPESRLTTEKIIPSPVRTGEEIPSSPEAERAAALRLDTDDDGLDNADEIALTRTDPLRADTDGDGLADGDEVHVFKTDPTSYANPGSQYSDGTNMRT